MLAIGASKQSESVLIECTVSVSFGMEKELQNIKGRILNREMLSHIISSEFTLSPRVAETKSKFTHACME